jgi:signal transduction histidine kinase/phage shock protein PspC (stress-responsive transcriptional regulator)
MAVVTAASGHPAAPPVPPAPPLRRDPAHGVVGGVCAGLGRRLGIDPIILRVLFVVTAAAGGSGIAVYLVAWVAIPAEGTDSTPVTRLAGRRDTWLVAGGIVMLALSVLLLLRQWGIWFSDAFVWPVLLVAAGAALIWRQASTRSEVPPPPTVAPARPRPPPAPAAAPAEPLLGRTGDLLGRLRAEAVGRAWLGVTLVVVGGIAFLYLNGALVAARDVVLAVLVVLVALTVILAPWWLRLVRGLSAERAERIRSQERAELAAHLHDSVLQTLALVQRRADDPREVAGLARRQERELRAWLNRGGPVTSTPNTLAVALEQAAAEVEETHGVQVDVVAVGDAPLDTRGEALVAAAREAVVNAAKFAGGGPVSVFAEADDGRLQVFVRDRGPGFDPAAVPPDRRGVRESIVGRMERHGGHAEVHTAPGAGTEVELTIDRA